MARNTATPTTSRMPMPPERIISPRIWSRGVTIKPVPRGLELKIRDKLEHLAELDRTSPRQRRKS